MAGDLNGHTVIGGPVPIRDVADSAMLDRIERALERMTYALKASGFSVYEAGEINLQTRFAIAGLIKERARRR